MQRGFPLHKAGEARLPSLGHLRRGKRMGRILIACRQGLNQIERSFNASGGKRFEANRAEALNFGKCAHDIPFMGNTMRLCPHPPLRDESLRLPSSLRGGLKYTASMYCQAIHEK